MESVFEIEIAPDDPIPKMLVVPTKQKSKRAKHVSKKGREMLDAKDAIGN
jgi:hypothetical protein